MYNRLKIIALLMCTVHFSCDSFLDEIPDRSLSTLDNIDAYQQLMNNPILYTSAPAIQELASDDFIISEDAFHSFDIRTRVAHLWQITDNSMVVDMGTTQDWSFTYNNIYYCNVVLEGLEELQIKDERADYNELKSHALFVRAFQHYLLYQVYGQPYDPRIAASTLGIPYKRSAFLEEEIARETVADNFDQMIDDLEQSLVLTSITAPSTNVYKPSKSAIHALLSRLYLVMQNYDASLSHARASLNNYNELLDYNSLSGFQFTYLQHPEILFYTSQSGAGLVYRTPTTEIDPELYDLYLPGDLRKEVFFRINDQTGRPFFGSMYSGISDPFGGLATNEVYLNIAECCVRIGDVQCAIDALNILRSKRYKPEYFEELVEIDQESLMETVLNERRKELVVRGTRWSDLRRLNQDPRFSKTLRRNINGIEYSLPPGDPRYSFPIPPLEVVMSNLIQNDY